MQRPTSLSGRGRGFSLVEIIFAASLLSLVMVMMFNLYPTSLITIRQAEHRLTAASRAQHLLDYERTQSFDTLLAAVGPSPSATPSPNDPPSDDGVQYIADLTIAPPASPLNNPTKLLHLTVEQYWNERSDSSAPAAYHSWHKLTTEVDVCDIKQ